MRVVLTGADGLLGGELYTLLRQKTADLDLWLENETDIADAAAVAARMQRAAPELVLHTAAWTAVDAAEGNPDRAFAVNAWGTFHLARAAEAAGALFVYLSTDYVFDGRQEKPYRPEDETNPLSVYGRSKLAGEYLTRQYAPRRLIVRTSSLFGLRGAGFPEKLCDRARNGGPLKVIDDQWSCPTYAPDLAAALLALAESGAEGLFHLAGPEAMTWSEFAGELARRLELPNPLQPVPAAEMPFPAPRPQRSVLDSSAAAERGVNLPPFADSLSRYLEQRGPELRRRAGLA